MTLPAPLPGNGTLGSPLLPQFNLRLPSGLRNWIRDSHPPVPLFLRNRDWSDRTAWSRPLSPFSPLPPPEEKDLELLGDFFLPKLMAMLFKFFQGLVEGVESPVHMLKALPVFGQEGECEGPVENGEEKLLEESGGKFPGGESDEGRIGGPSDLSLPIPCQGMKDPDPLREVMAPMVDEDPVKS